MARGMKYNLQFKLKDGSFKEVNELNMANLMKTIKDLFNSEYNIDSSLISISNQVIFNLMHTHSKRTVNKFIGTYCKVSKYVKDEEEN